MLCDMLWQIAPTIQRSCFDTSVNHHTPPYITILYMSFFFCQSYNTSFNVMNTFLRDIFHLETCSLQEYHMVMQSKNLLRAQRSQQLVSLKQAQFPRKYQFGETASHQASLCLSKQRTIQKGCRICRQKLLAHQSSALTKSGKAVAALHTR